MSEWKKDNAIHIHWLMSEWCNYCCPYCSQTHDKNAKYFRGRTILKKMLKNPSSVSKNIKLYLKSNYKHSFNNYDHKTWVKSFDHLSPQSVSLLISGGEPFLDVNNFKLLLISLGEMDHIKCMRIDTNGSWKASAYKGVKWEKMYLNISYHPTMIKRDIFIKQIYDKLDYSINISMVNYVIEPSQIREFYEVKSILQKMNVYVHPNVYFGNNKQVEEGYNIYKKYLPDIDILLKTKQIKTKGMACSYPCYSYFLHPTGAINVSCFPSLYGNFIENKIPKRLDNTIKCPSDHCGCINMYAFLEIVDRAKKLNLLEEYVDICKKNETL